MDKQRVLSKMRKCSLIKEITAREEAHNYFNYFHSLRQHLHLSGSILILHQNMVRLLLYYWVKLVHVNIS
jgi:hypothetical protein